MQGLFCMAENLTKKFHIKFKFSSSFSFSLPSPFHFHFHFHYYFSFSFFISISISIFIFISGWQTPTDLPHVKFTCKIFFQIYPKPLPPASQRFGINLGAFLRRDSKVDRPKTLTVSGTRMPVCYSVCPVLCCV